MEKPILVKETVDSPLVEFDPENGKLHIKGKSLLENTYEFYAPLLEAVNRFVNSETTPLKVKIQYDYLNSSTSRYFMELLMILENSDAEHEIMWYYEYGDDVIEEKGYQFKSLVEINFYISMFDLNRA